MKRVIVKKTQVFTRQMFSSSYLDLSSLKIPTTRSRIVKQN